MVKKFRSIFYTEKRQRTNDVCALLHKYIYLKRCLYTDVMYTSGSRLTHIEGERRERNEQVCIRTDFFSLLVVFRCARKKEYGNLSFQSVCPASQLCIPKKKNIKNACIKTGQDLLLSTFLHYFFLRWSLLFVVVVVVQ